MPKITHSYATNNYDKIVGAILTPVDHEDSINERIQLIKGDLEKIHRQQETT